MFTILPLPWATMIRPASWQSSKVAVRLTSITSSQSARSWSTASEARPMPCELTRMSRPPSRSTASSKPRRRSSRSARSARTAMPPSSAAASSALSERPSTATRRARVGERARQPAPDPAAAARDERAASGQVEGAAPRCGVAGAELGEDPCRLAVGLLDELDHPVGLRHPLELDRDRAREAGVEDRLQVLLDRRHAAAGRHVAVHLAVAVGDVHVADHPGRAPRRRRTTRRRDAGARRRRSP